ncbi:MAG: hypothetical protein LBC17_02680 [Lactobacillaceae bacterium]|jgi:hypothetical protein|nr:hypothetical protein [Lactobacillaceae bacterium]
MDENELNNQNFQSGLGFFNQGDFYNAVQIFNALYQKDPTNISYNNFLSSSLFFNKQFDEAFDVLSDMPSTYGDTEDKIEMALKISLEVNQFLFAREFVLKNVKKNIDDKIKIIEEFEKQYLETHIENVKNNQKSLIYLGSGTLLKEQEIKFEQSLTLPFTQWVNAAQIALLDDLVSPLLKSTILEIITRLKYQNKVDYLWIDEKKYSYNPQTGKELLTTTQYKKMLSYLDEINDDSSIYDAVVAYIRMFISIVYPKLNQIPDLNNWVDLLIQKAKGNSDIENLADQLFLKVQDQVDYITKEIS